MIRLVEAVAIKFNGTIMIQFKQIIDQFNLILQRQFKRAASMWSSMNEKPLKVKYHQVLFKGYKNFQLDRTFDAVFH